MLKAVTQLGNGSWSRSDLICVALVRSSTWARGRSAKKGRKLRAKRVTGSKARLSQW